MPYYDSVKSAWMKSVALPGNSTVIWPTRSEAPGSIGGLDALRWIPELRGFAAYPGMTEWLCVTTARFDAGQRSRPRPQAPTLASTSARRKRSMNSMNSTEGTSRISAVIEAT